MRHPEARLVDVSIDLRRGGHVVTSAWTVVGRDNARTATATSDDGFVTASFEMVEPSEQFLPIGPPRPAAAPTRGSCAQVVGRVDLCSDYSTPRFTVQWTFNAGANWARHPFDMPPMLCGPETSLRPDTFAVVCGGDGATLLPFELALRSDDLGATWRSFELPEFEGERAYVSGSVVTSDGRLLSLLNAFSGDRFDRPSARHHGLYISAGSDWSSFAVLQPRFSPHLTPAPPGSSPLSRLTARVRPDPVIVATTWDERAYVSTDDAATFREIPVR